MTEDEYEYQGLQARIAAVEERIQQLRCTLQEHDRLWTKERAEDDFYGRGFLVHRIDKLEEALGRLYDAAF